MGKRQLFAFNFHNRCSSHFASKFDKFARVSLRVEMNFPDLEKGQKNFRLRSIFRPQSIFRRLFVSLGGRLMKWSSWKTQIYWIRFLFETNSHQFARTKAAWKTATYLKRDKKAEVAAAAFVSPPSSTQPNHSSSSANSPRSLVILSHVQHAPRRSLLSALNIDDWNPF